MLWKFPKITLFVIIILYINPELQLNQQSSNLKKGHEKKKKTRVYWLPAVNSHCTFHSFILPKSRPTDVISRFGRFSWNLEELNHCLSLCAYSLQSQSQGCFPITHCFPLRFPMERKGKFTLRKRETAPLLLTRWRVQLQKW